MKSLEWADKSDVDREEDHIQDERYVIWEET
jgi:hypothetical protein